MDSQYAARVTQRPARRDLVVLSMWDGACAVFKPPGLPSETTSDSTPSALAQAKEQFHWPEARLPHRLDAPTAGVLVIARDRAAAASLNDDIRERRWRKFYLARVQGDARQLMGTHRCYLKPGRGRGSGPRHQARRAEVVRSGGDPASLEIIRADWDPASETTQLVIELHTGRYHQIRAMCAWMRHPLVGDSLYGGCEGTIELVHAVLSLPMPRSKASVDEAREMVRVTLPAGVTSMTTAQASSIETRLRSPAAINGPRRQPTPPPSAT